MTMDTKYFEDYQKQFVEMQQKFLGTWLGSLPNGQNAFKLPDTLDQGIEIQEEVVRNYLAAQETAVKLALETQKKFWDNYFELLKKATSAKVEATPYQ